jgi:hypothetical protein
MAMSMKESLMKIDTVMQAWSKLRPSKTFSGLTLEQGQAGVKPSYDVRAEIADAELRLQSANARRVTVDAASLDIVRRIVNAVKSDPQEGEDGELYAAMGFVRRSDRSSGLTRRRKNADEKGPATAPKEGTSA